MSDTSEVQGLVEQHLEWKNKATVVLHEWANDREHCYDFDEILEDVGLPGRPAYYEYWGREPLVVAGEDTVEEFEAWKLETSKVFHQKARYYGFARDSYEPILQAAGFLGHDDLFKTVEAKIEGSFSIPLTVEVPVGEDLVNQVRRDKVRSAVINWAWSSDFDWKIVVADQPEDAQR